MPTLTKSSVAFIGLNVLRLVSLVVILLVLTTLIMGLIEDVKDYHNGDNMDEAKEEDCAYVPGTSIPMQTWGIFWVEFHRMLLIIGVICSFLAEISWTGITRLEILARQWMPVLSVTRGLAALGMVHIVISTSILSHYLDEFPLVVSWMLFIIGVLYLALGTLFHTTPLKDVRSLFSHRRAQVKDHIYTSKEGFTTFANVGRKDYGSTSPTNALKGWLIRKGKGHSTSNKPSINDTFPTLEPSSHRELLQQRARRASHRRQTSSVAIEIQVEQQDPADQSSITRDFVWEPSHGVVCERSDPNDITSKKRNSGASYQSSSFNSVASSTQVRIGGYASAEAARARAKAKRRRGAAEAGQNQFPPPAKSTGTSSITQRNTSKMRNMKRRSVALVNTARSRLSAGTASALAGRRHATRKGIPHPERAVVTSYVEDEATAPPIPPLPAYHQATNPPIDDMIEVHSDAAAAAIGGSSNASTLPVADRYLGGQWG